MTPRRRLIGWGVLIAGTIVGGAAWFTAWGTYQPGFGFEDFTVPAALVGITATVVIGVGHALLDRPRAVSVLCLGAAVAMAVVIYGLAQDIPGTSARGTPAFAEEYRSRLEALSIAGAGALVLGGVGCVGLFRHRQRTMSARRDRSRSRLRAAGGRS